MGPPGYIVHNSSRFCSLLKVVATCTGLGHVTNMRIYGRARNAREEAFCDSPSLCSVRRRWLARMVDTAVERL